MSNEHSLVQCIPSIIEVLGVGPPHRAVWRRRLPKDAILRLIRSKISPALICWIVHHLHIA